MEIQLSELPTLARQVLEKVEPHADHAFLITLQGELGAGKTTFMQALARELGIAEAVQSPTYVLMKSYDIAYKGHERLVHIDAYRLEAPAQFAALKPEVFLNDPKNIVCIEWPERLAGALPKADIALRFAHSREKGDGVRIVGLEVE